MTTSGSEFSYFLRTEPGSVWYIPDGMSLTDTGNTYFENGGQGGGVYYCDSCTMTITDATFTDHIASDGGIFYLMNDFTVVVDDSYIGHSKSIQDGTNYGNGGGVYVGAGTYPGSPAATLTFKNCKNAA